LFIQWVTLALNYVFRNFRGSNYVLEDYNFESLVPSYVRIVTNT
jgi:hypothetical protein